MAQGIPVDLRVVMSLQALGVPQEAIGFRCDRLRHVHKGSAAYPAGMLLLPQAGECRVRHGPCRMLLQVCLA